ncbi:MAG: hypothetical protein JWP29_2270 [Rhodoferax sp.]|nr:hypothetical protein [Rhodoferax sp.]
MAYELPQYRDTVRAEWGDYNGHLRDAFYGLIFSYATDALMDRLGLDAVCRARTQCSIYTVEYHINFLQEVKVGAEVQVTTQVLAADAKRLHVYHAMTLLDGAEGSTDPVAVSEQMLLHVDTRGPKSAVFTPEVMLLVRAMAAEHAGLARPAYAGRVIRLP